MAAAALSMGATAIGGTALQQRDWGVIAAALAPTGGAQIIQDTSLAGAFSSTVSSFTVAMTLGAVANYLLAFVIGDATSDKVTGVTYDAVAMTQLVKFYAGSTIGWLYLYGLASPTVSASKNIIVSASGSCSVLGVEAQSYVNCNATQPNVSATASFKASSIAWATLVPTTGGCWGVACTRFSGSGVPSTVVASGSGTTAALRVSGGSSDLGSIIDTNGVIPFISPVTLTPNAAQWRLQRADISRTKQEKLA